MKNHVTLIDSIHILTQEFNKDIKLVLCGYDIGYKEYLEEYVNKKKLDKNIFFLEYVEDEYLPYLYRGASMLVMPSLIGPTNIPPWEAFKMKKPVIYSDIEGIREVLGDAVYYIDPLNKHSIVDGIKKIFSSAELKNKLIEKGFNKLKEIEERHEFKKFFKIIEDYEKRRRLWK